MINNSDANQRRVWCRVAEILPAAVSYENYLVDIKTSILQMAWAEIREIYTKGIFVRLFNPRLVEWFEANKKIKLDDRKNVAHIFDILLPEHAWKLDYAWTCHEGELEYIRGIITQCRECLSPETGMVIVTQGDIEMFQKLGWNT